MSQVEPDRCANNVKLAIEDGQARLPTMVFQADVGTQRQANRGCTVSCANMKSTTMAVESGILKSSCDKSGMPEDVRQGSTRPIY